MAKTLRKNISKKTTSRKHKKSKKNVKHYSRNNKINNIIGGDVKGEVLDGILLKNIRENDQSLTELKISDPELNDDQANQLANALKINNVVTSIKLNKISYIGAKALISVLFRNKTLTEFEISNEKDMHEKDKDIMAEFEFITKRNLFLLNHGPAKLKVAKLELEDSKNNSNAKSRDDSKNNSNSKMLADFTNKFYKHLETDEFYIKNKSLIDSFKIDIFGGVVLDG